METDIAHNKGAAVRRADVRFKMRFEFAFRTYNTFGPNATLGLAGKWVEKQLRPNYGGNVRSVIVEICCRNISPPKKTLEDLHEKFEAWLRELPYYEYVTKESEVRICFEGVLYTHQDVRRDSQVLSVKTFQQAIGKAAQLAIAIPQRLPDLDGFDSETLADDLQRLRNVAPKTLDDLAALYIEKSGENVT